MLLFSSTHVSPSPLLVILLVRLTLVSLGQVLCVTKPDVALIAGVKTLLR